MGQDCHSDWDWQRVWKTLDAIGDEVELARGGVPIVIGSERRSS